jgi:hypothetical protein
MKRLSYTAQMAQAVREGRKTWTTRKLSCSITLGDVFAGVEAKDGKPAFLTPADDGFAILKCTATWLRSPNSFTEEEARMEGFDSKAEYIAYWQNLNPTKSADDHQKVIVFEVVELR